MMGLPERGATTMMNGGYAQIKSFCGGESSESELTVLLRHTKVVVTDNNRTKSVLVRLQGIVKKALSLGGWHWLRAIEKGADFVETDILATKDGKLLCFHDVILHEMTDIANHKEFVNRKRTYEVQGQNITGWFVGLISPLKN